MAVTGGVWCGCLWEPHRRRTCCGVSWCLPWPIKLIVGENLAPVFLPGLFFCTSLTVSTVDNLRFASGLFRLLFRGLLEPAVESLFYISASSIVATDKQTQLVTDGFACFTVTFKPFIPFEPLFFRLCFVSNVLLYLLGSCIGLYQACSCAFTSGPVGTLTNVPR